MEKKISIKELEDLILNEIELVKTIDAYTKPQKESAIREMKNIIKLAKHISKC